MTKKEFVGCLRYLVELNLPGYKKFSATKQEIWYQALQDLTIDQFKGALVKVVKESEFFPTVAAIRKHAGITNAAIKEDKKDLAELAWGEVMTAIAKVGPYQTPKFSNKLIMKVISNRGGWGRLCEMSFDQLEFEARSFKNIYVLFEDERQVDKVDYYDGKRKQLIDMVKK